MTRTSDAYWLRLIKLSDEFIEALGSAGSVLDIGCAGGRVLRYMALEGCLCYGLDADASLISQLQAMHPEWVLRCGDYNLAESWDFGRTFDLIASNYAIRKDYCSDLAKFASYCKSTLAPGGRIAFKIQSPEDLSTIIKKEKRQSLFFSDQELLEAFSDFDLSIQVESYKQQFSNLGYIREFMSRTNLADTYLEGCKALRIQRHHWIVQGSLRLT